MEVSKIFWETITLRFIGLLKDELSKKNISKQFKKMFVN